MLNILAEVRTLREEGKLHSRLVTRTRMLLGISCVLGIITAYNLIFRGGNAFIAATLAIGGFTLGLTVFSRMSAVNWNEEESVVQTEKMDKVGFSVLGLYIIFEIGLRTFLRDFYPTSATTFILAGVSGTLLGRAIGTVIEIHRVYIANHPK